MNCYNTPRRQEYKEEKWQKFDQTSVLTCTIEHIRRADLTPSYNAPTKSEAWGTKSPGSTANISKLVHVHNMNNDLNLILDDGAAISVIPPLA